MPLSSVKLKEDDRVNVEPTAVAGISAFLGKLWKMVEDPKTDNLISWGKSGTTFVIKNQIDFAKTILPNYYKHNNIASFIRQLNMYGFHKIISTTSGALDSNDNDEIEFTHPCFVRGHPYMLEQIKRKMNNPKENFSKSESSNQFSESIKRVFSDIKNLKGKQEHLGSQLSAVKQENEILWRELSLLRQKHAAQQNVLNKLIRFLVSLAQPANHGIVKRRLVPLMLKDSSSSSSRSKQEPIIQDSDHLYTLKKRRDELLSPGPTIHEIHPSEVLDNVQVIETPMMELTADSPVVLENEMITSPAPSISNSDANLSSPEPIPTALLLPTTVCKNKNLIQKVYVPSSQAVPTHFLISQPSVSRSRSPEYLIPENTDNPLMELVHETVADDDGDYITVVASDGVDVSQNSPEPVITEKSKKRITRKKNANSTNITKPVASKGNNDMKRKSISTTDEKQNDSDDFLVDLSNLNEPLVEIHTPSASGITSQAKVNIEGKALDTIENPSELLKNKIDINVDEIIGIPASTSNLSDLGLTIDDSSIVSTEGVSADDADNVVFDLNENNAQSFIQKPEGGGEDNRADNELLMNRINECIDNAENMKIACTDSSAAPSRTYVDDISSQLDTMQTDLNQLKELIQNEGLTLDVNTLMGLFNEDPLDYNMPSDSSSGFPKPNDKVSGNEIISAPAMFDFNDIFSQSDWSQPNTPLSTIDNDYCELNTPQIETSATDDSQIMHPPPSKKIKS